MSTKAQYCEIFGLHENASKDEIRKAYRKLAMQYHPDKNSDPKAHQIFIDLAEAYEILIGDKFNKEQNVVKKRNEKTFEERKKEAEHRFKKQQIREEKEQNAYFKKLTSGLKWSIFKKIAYVSLFFSIILFIEPLLPKHLESHTILEFSPKYSGILNGDVICFKTDKNLQLFIKNPDARLYSTNPEILIERSWFFHNPTKVWSKTAFINDSYEVDFSVLSLFPTIPILLLFPVFTIYFKRKSVKFTLAYFVSFYFIGIFLIYFVFTQERWLHILTLGFV
ncbi:MAG: DnaJ domain-containing protein [Bacteroidota bacterium]